MALLTTARRVPCMKVAHRILQSNARTTAIGRSNSSSQVGNFEKSSTGPLLQHYVDISRQPSDLNPNLQNNHECVMALSSQLENLKVIALSAPQVHQTSRQKEYILPTTIQNSFHKKILDPDLLQTCYELPTNFNTSVEKLTPGLVSIFPKVDPNPLQRVIDEGSQPIVKETMPYLLRIRRKKMKKHKLKKFRKRMIFQHRRQAEIKRKRKDRAVVEYQNKWSKIAEQFDPQKDIDDKLYLARKGGYGRPLFTDKVT